MEADIEFLLISKAGAECLTRCPEAQDFLEQNLVSGGPIWRFPNGALEMAWRREH